MMTENLTAIDFYQPIKALDCTRRSLYLYLREQGFSYEQIADFLGVSKRTVYNTVNDRHFKPSDKTLQDLEYLRSRQWLV